MAMEEITLTPEEQAAANTTFFKWTKGIGEKFSGRFIRTQEQTGTYAKKGRLDYVFKYKDEAGAVREGVLTGVDLEMKLKKANLKPGISRVAITHVEDRDIQKDNPMKVFKVLVDHSPAAGAAAAPAPKPPPPPAADDIDY